MNRGAQAIVLIALGGVTLRVAATDEYARYVNEWMRWPLLVSAVLLIGLAVWAVLRVHDDPDGSAQPGGEDGHGHDGVEGQGHGGHGSTRVAWFLVVPVLVAAVVQPPALGSFLADRSANSVDPAAVSEAVVAPLPEGQVNVLPVAGFVARAATDGGASLVDRDVRLTGFVTTGDDGTWYLNRLTIACCAADAAAFRVEVQAEEMPDEEQWVEVTGRWVEGTGETTGSGEVPALAADAVVLIDAPARPYE